MNEWASEWIYRNEGMKLPFWINCSFCKNRECYNLIQEWALQQMPCGRAQCQSWKELRDHVVQHLSQVAARWSPTRGPVKTFILWVLQWHSGPSISCRQETVAPGSRYSAIFLWLSFKAGEWTVRFRKIFHREWDSSAENSINRCCTVEFLCKYIFT